MMTANLSWPTTPAAAAAAYPLSSANDDSAALARWLAQSLDHVGRGMLLASAGARVLFANRLARLALAAGDPLSVAHGRLCAGPSQDTAALLDALDAAARRGLRRMLHLGSGADAYTVAVLPLDADGAGAALVSLPQTRCTQDLAVHSYARQHGFTAAETAVLEALVAGRSPATIAGAKGVQLSTVRTQIGQLRMKCGAHSIRELLDRVLALPPMMAVMQ
jgi:DNA-binding CsgD family transcriptional regulator